MKTIGLLGGMSWESTLPYYRIMNETVRAHWGGLHSAKILLYSFDFSEIERLQPAGAWEEAGDVMVDAARRLEHAGAELLVICSNTMHRVADELETRIGIPLLHIADATAQAIQEAGHRTIGLLGTRYTMEQEFYSGRLRERHGLTVLTPGETDRTDVHRIIYEELCVGEIYESSRDRFRDVLQTLANDGAEGVILGCTEFALLVDQSLASVPLYDTAALHARTAALWALED